MNLTYISNGLRVQLKDIAERLPVAASRSGKSPSTSDLPNGFGDHFSSQATHHEPEIYGSGNFLPSNGSSPSSNRNSSYTKLGNSDPATRNGNTPRESENRHDTEKVEQDEPGVYITLTTLPGGVKDLKRVRFRYVSCKSINIGFIIPIRCIRVTNSKQFSNLVINHLVQMRARTNARRIQTINVILCILSIPPLGIETRPSFVKKLVLCL